MKRFSLIFCLSFAMSAVFISAQQAHALATADATAEATITITGFTDAAGMSIPRPAGLVIAGFVDFIPGLDTFEDSFGTGVAVADGSATVFAAGGDTDDLDIGDSVELTASAFASASAPPDSFAFADSFPFADIGIDNGSATDVAVTFDLDWSYLVDTSAMSIDEFAFAFSDIFIDASTGEILFDIIDIFDPINLFDVPFSDTDLGGGLLTDSGSASFSLLVPAGDFEVVFADLDTEAFALAFNPIPEPITTTLTLMGLSALALSTRRRSA